MNQKPNPKLVLRDTYLKSAQQPAELNDIQVNREFVQLIQQAATNSSYWRDRLPTTLIDQGTDAITRNLTKFPIMTRLDVQQAFDESQIYLPGSRDSDYLVAATSGSTGTPARITKYLPMYVLEYDAITLLEWRWFRRDIKKPIVKIIYGKFNVEKANWGEPISLLGDPEPGFTIKTESEDIPKLVDLVLGMKPAYLYGMPSTITTMAHELLKTGNRFAEITQVLTAGETLQDWQRDLFKTAYQDAKVVDRYSAEEFGYIAMQCPRANHLHVIAPSVYIEILNENNEPCEIGELGRVVVTGLHTFAQPLIRYEIGDLARWGEPTGCGITWPIIESIEGRVHDFKLLPDGSKRRITFARTEYIKNPKLIDYQVLLFDDAIVAMLSVTDHLTISELELAETEISARVNLNLPLIIRQTNLYPLFSKAKRNPLEIVKDSYKSELSDADILGLVKS